MYDHKRYKMMFAIGFRKQNKGSNDATIPKNNSNCSIYYIIKYYHHRN